MSQLKSNKNFISKTGKSPLSSTVVQFLLFGAVVFVVFSLILYSLRGASERPQQDSMLDDEQVISEYERRELREIMDRYYGKTGVSMSYHIAPLNPKPKRVGPNSFTIGIATRTGEVIYRIPRGLKPLIDKEPQELIDDLTTRFELCMKQSIERKYPHCLKDTLIAIEEQTGDIDEPLKLQSK